MTAIASTRLTEYSAPLPAMGTLPSAANSLFYKGTLAVIDASGNAAVPTDGDGLPAAGVVVQTIDNRTGSAFGGLAGDVDIELNFGVAGFEISGATPIQGQRLYVVDNQTVSVDDNGGQRGYAGPCVEVRDGQAFVFISPVGTAVGAGGALASVGIPVALGGARLSTGAAIPAFSDGVADGFEYVDSEAFGLRLNVGSTTTFITSVDLPGNLDESQDLTVYVRGFRVGAADTDATLAIEAFFQTIGAAHTADADAGGSTTAFDGATTIVTEESLTIAAANVPAGPCTLTLSITADATLDSDDLVILGVRVEGARA